MREDGRGRAPDEMCDELPVGMWLVWGVLGGVLLWAALIALVRWAWRAVMHF